MKKITIFMGCISMIACSNAQNPASPKVSDDCQKCAQATAALAQAKTAFIQTSSVMQGAKLTPEEKRELNLDVIKTSQRLKMLQDRQKTVCIRCQTEKR